MKRLINREIWDYPTKWLLFLEKSGELILNDCKGLDDCRCSWVTGDFEKENDKLYFFSSFRKNVRKKNAYYYYYYYYSLCESLNLKKIK